MTKLSVNVNKLATLRNSRGKNNPDVIKGALDIVRFGADGITVHPRPDERHIRRRDVYQLKDVLTVELNIEGYPSEDFIRMVEEVRPAQCTLVPDPPHVLTSNAGWAVRGNQEILAMSAKRFAQNGVRTSVFVDPYTMAADEYEILRKLGVSRVELYTEKYAEEFSTTHFEAVKSKYVLAAEAARGAGLEVNAGHDLNTENLEALVASIPWMAEVSIGHALICDALYWGLETTVQKYLHAIRRGAEAASDSGRK